MILDIDKLINTVMTVIEKRLDFDRGMIMLTNESKTRLVYSAGYGYSKEKEKVIHETEFHLDDPESKGPFVLAFKEQKPFLVNDISGIEKNPFHTHLFGYYFNIVEHAIKTKYPLSILEPAFEQEFKQIGKEVKDGRWSEFISPDEPNEND